MRNHVFVMEPKALCCDFQNANTGNNSLCKLNNCGELTVTQTPVLNASHTVPQNIIFLCVNRTLKDIIN